MLSWTMSELKGHTPISTLNPAPMPVLPSNEHDALANAMARGPADQSKGESVTAIRSAPSIVEPDTVYFPAMSAVAVTDAFMVWATSSSM